MFPAKKLSALVLCLGFVLCSSISDKVEVGFYSEALCPDCLAFSNGDLAKAFREVGDILTLKYVPWGNAEIIEGGTFECQHGKMECVMNTVMACVLNYYPNQTDFWPFLHCIDSYKERQNLDVAKKCAQETKLDWVNINNCQAGDMGKSLEIGYANITNQLSPPHQYTPWITINGEHNKQAENGRLVKAICDKYKGNKIPKACN